MDATARYREYLSSFGIVDSGDRLGEIRDLDAGSVRFFAYAGSEGLRLKAAVTSAGIVTPGGRAEDDWHGFLEGLPDAAGAAERIAWLETDATTPPHALPLPPTLALTPQRKPPIAIDPAQWALVTAPALHSLPDGGLSLTAWLLPGGALAPERWTVIARRGSPAVIERASAAELLAAAPGGTRATTLEADLRAERLLAAGSEDERRWALRHLADSSDRAAFPDVALLLARGTAEPATRLLAAATLARLAEPAAVGPLATALRSDSAPEVRRACAQALAHLTGSPVVEALAAAAPGETDATVRAEIVHALASQGSAAAAALDRIARADPDPSIRRLARHALPRSLPGDEPERG